MTWWRPLDVLAYAKGAGFDNDDAKRAATVAFVVSAGADHYVHDPLAGPAFVQAGLWGLPAKLVESVEGGDQLHPITSADTAHTLWLAGGRRWDWHPVVRVDGGALVRRSLDALDKDGLWTAKAAEWFSSVDHLRAFTYTSKRIEQFLARFPVER